MDYSMTLKKSPLFRGVEPEEIRSMLSCLNANEGTYKKGEFIFRNGDRLNTMGLVLSGSVHIIKEDFWGNRTIIGIASAGRLFGETYACVQSEPLEVGVVAAETAEILFLDARRIITVCTSACEFHTRLIQNLLSVLAEKNLMLTKKMEHMARKTTREKLLSYLSEQSLKQGSPVFEIPFNRQQLAEYLAVDRSAMSSELGKLRDEGILTFNKNKFHLLEN